MIQNVKYIFLRLYFMIGRVLDYVYKESVAEH